MLKENLVLKVSKRIEALDLATEPTHTQIWNSRKIHWIYLTGMRNNKIDSALERIRIHLESNLSFSPRIELIWRQSKNEHRFLHNI